MVARESIEQYRVASSQLSALVADELARYFGALDMSRPEAVRNALLEFVPLLVAEYGQAAAALAMEWYEQLRFESGASGSFVAAAVLASAITPERVEAKVRYAAGHLFDRTYEVEDEGRLIVVRKPASPAKALASLTGATDKYVKQYGRETVAWNAQREGVRWARVPTGAKTCSWCLILASRDAAYLSERSALSRADGDKYHGWCDCQAVPIRPDEDYPEGYLPSDYYDMYQVARDAAGSGDMRDIAAAMRREFPDAVNDGAHTH